jgi:hypothetical protein
VSFLPRLNTLDPEPVLHIDVAQFLLSHPYAVFDWVLRQDLQLHILLSYRAIELYFRLIEPS